MSRSVNIGPFEPALSPVGVEVRAPTGIARLLAAEQAHLEDLARTPGATDEEEEMASTTPSHEEFITDAARYAAACGRNGVVWDRDLEEAIYGACAKAGIELTTSEKAAIYEAWDTTFQWK